MKVNWAPPNTALRIPAALVAQFYKFRPCRFTRAGALSHAYNDSVRSNSILCLSENSAARPSLLAYLGFSTVAHLTNGSLFMDDPNWDACSRWS